MPTYRVQVIYYLEHPDGQGEQSETLTTRGDTRRFFSGTSRPTTPARFKTADQAQRKAERLGYRHFRVWETDDAPDKRGMYPQRVVRYVQPHTQPDLPGI